MSFDGCRLKINFWMPNLLKLAGSITGRVGGFLYQHAMQQAPRGTYQATRKLPQANVTCQSSQVCQMGSCSCNILRCRNTSCWTAGDIGQIYSIWGSCSSPANGGRLLHATCKVPCHTGLPPFYPAAMTERRVLHYDAQVSSGLLR
jgi:hypothetical protein